MGQTIIVYGRKGLPSRHSQGQNVFTLEWFCSPYQKVVGATPSLDEGPWRALRDKHTWSETLVGAGQHHIYSEILSELKQQVEIHHCNILTKADER